MRTKYITWTGTHSNSTLLLNCIGGPHLADLDPSPALGETELGDLPPTECEDWDYPEDYILDDLLGVRATGNGCKRFFASFDATGENAQHRHLVSLYPRRLVFVNESGVGVIDAGPIQDFVPIPVTSVCDVAYCSYQNIGRCRDDSLGMTRLSHRRFTDEYTWCAGGTWRDCDDDAVFDEFPITLGRPSLMPMATGVSADAAVVAYQGGYDDILQRGDLLLTVIDN